MQGVTPRCSMKCCLWALVKFLKALSFTGSMPNRLRIFTSRRGGLRKLRVVVMDVLNHMDVSKMMAVVTEVWVLRFQGWSQPRSSGLFLLWVSPPEIGKLGQQEPMHMAEIPLVFWDLLMLLGNRPFCSMQPPRTNHSWSFQPFRKGPPARSWFANPSNYTHRPRGLPGLQHGGFPVVEHEKRNCRKYAYTQCFLHSDSEFSGF